MVTAITQEISDNTYIFTSLSYNNCLKIQHVNMDLELDKIFSIAQLCLFIMLHIIYFSEGLTDGTNSL